MLQNFRIMDDAFDKPTSEKKDNSSRWSRTGYYINVEHDLTFKRYRKPDVTDQSEHHSNYLETLHADLEEAENEFNKALKAETAARTTLKKREDLDAGVPPKTKMQRKLLQVDIVDLRRKKR